MKTNKLLFLTLLVSACCLTACNSNPEDEDQIVVDNSTDKTADHLFLNRRMVSLMVDEELPLVGKPQINHDGKNLKYECADTSIATVSEDGTVKGIKAGHTSITVSDKSNPELKAEIPVMVSAEISGSEQSALVNEFKNDTTEVKAVVNNELYEQATYKNGVLQKYDCEEETMVASYNDAYFRITASGSEIITENGDFKFSSMEWIFYTNPYYDTLVYHTDGDVKNYYPVATQSYMEEERTVPLFAILDNIFVSGSEIFTNVFRYASVSTAVSNIGTEEGDVVGSAGPESLFFTSSASWPNETASQDDETRYGIPFGTLTPTTQDMRFTIKDGRVANIDIHIKSTYTIGEDEYEEITDIVYSYEEIDAQKSQIIIPNRKDYTLVDYLFAI